MTSFPQYAFGYTAEGISQHEFQEARITGGYLAGWLSQHFYPPLSFASYSLFSLYLNFISL